MSPVALFSPNRFVIFTGLPAPDSDSAGEPTVCLGELSRNTLPVKNLKFLVLSRLARGQEETATSLLSLSEIFMPAGFFHNSWASDRRREPTGRAAR
jgi:hypothetical protein